MDNKKVLVGILGSAFVGLVVAGAKILKKQKAEEEAIVVELEEQDHE